MEKEPGDSSRITDLFMELASETRFSLLESLIKKPAKMSSLSREFDSSVQDIYRNLKRLMEEGLVRRADGMFYITEYGMVVAKQIPDLQFMQRHRQFFEDHRLAGVIPDKFLQRIGALNNCKTVSSVTGVLQKLKKLEASAKNSLKLAVAQAWPEEGEILIDKAASGTEILTVVGHNTVIPKDVVELMSPRVEELVAKGTFKRRMVEKIDVAVYIADGVESGLMFPNSKGEIDMNTLFVSEDPMFNEWCMDFFGYTWERSRPFNESKLRIVEY